MNETSKKKSRTLSWLLRHGAREAGVAMDAAGWVNVAEVLRATSMTRAELEEIVRLNDKGRLELRDERVRACQGHSTENMPVTRDALEATWTERLDDDPIWHGTATDALPSIAERGLLPIRRTHVHLAAALESRVGKRAAVDVMLKVDSRLVRASGQRIFDAPNGVVLVRHVVREAIVDLTPMTRRSRGRERELRAIFGFR